MALAASTALPQRKQGHKHVAGGAVLRSGWGRGHKLRQIALFNFGFQVKYLPLSLRLRASARKKIPPPICPFGGE
jgi:hypothetical protein